MGVPSSSLQRELHDLSEVGILKTHRQGHMVYYQANTDSPVFRDLRGLLFKTAGFVDVLAMRLSHWRRGCGQHLFTAPLPPAASKATAILI
jgi:hypothetical protein